MSQRTHQAWIDAAMDGAGEDVMRDIFPWASDMDACDHDPIYHAEGSPWRHTVMVVEALEASEAFLNLPEERKRIMRVAAWMHDVGKPATTVYEICSETGRQKVRQPGHAPLGAKIAWQSLIDDGIDVQTARDIHALIFWHMRPSHMIGQGDEACFHKLVSYGAEAGRGSWNELLALCHADQNGRIAVGVSDDEKHLPLDLLEEAILDVKKTHEIDLMQGGWPFESDNARLTCLTKKGSVYHTPQDPKGSPVTMMSGLPGSGKDTFIAERFPSLPVVSLDQIRDEMKISATADQGRVRQEGLERARAHLRRGEPFVWNATCLSRVVRQKITQLARSYDAHITAISLDVPQDIAIARNAKRENAIPEKAIRELARKREPIGVDEAHEIWSVNEAGDLQQSMHNSSRRHFPEATP